LAVEHLTLDAWNKVIATNLTGYFLCTKYAAPHLCQTPEQSHLGREQQPVGRVGVPNDIAAMVALLISTETGFITGQNIVIDGGMTKRMIYAE
jgi:NAD(P)-dependent dehydrogenase (short-subunit alcohol dehydrogenase family)